MPQARWERDHDSIDASPLLVAAPRGPAWPGHSAHAMHDVTRERCSSLSALPFILGATSNGRSMRRAALREDCQRRTMPLFDGGAEMTFAE